MVHGNVATQYRGNVVAWQCALLNINTMDHNPCRILAPYRHVLRDFAAFRGAVEVDISGEARDDEDTVEAVGFKGGEEPVIRVCWDEDTGARPLAGGDLRVCLYDLRDARVVAHDVPARV